MPVIHAPEVPSGIDSATEHVFAALSATRGRRIFHPQGITLRATVRVETSVRGVSLLEEGAVHPAVVRFSRALGTPRGRLDFLGVALRIAERQDVLLASSAASPLLRCLPLPARTFAGTTFSSLLPFRVAGGLELVGARVRHVGAAPDDQLAQLSEAVASAPVTVTLALAGLRSRWRRVATVEVGERVADGEAGAVAFDPWICDGGLVPAGPINALRAPAYRGSRRGRGLPADAAAAAPPPDAR